MSVYCRMCEPKRRFGSRSKYMMHRREAHPTAMVRQPKVAEVAEVAPQKPQPKAKVAKAPLAAARPKAPSYPPMTEEIIRAAIVGFELARRQVQEQLDSLHALVKSSVVTSVVTSAKPSKSRMSPEGRARIALAQRRRWAAAKAQAAAIAAPTNGD